MNPLLTLEARLFIDSCDVVISEGEDAQMVWAEFLAGDGLALEQAS